MSILTKLILGSSVVGTVTLIYYVHRSQEEERARLHEGVVRDLERQRYKAQKYNDLQTTASKDKTL